MAIHEECGIFGIFDPSDDAARITYFALFSLQHRGQEGAGIATSNIKKLKIIKSQGLVAQVFNEENLGLLDGEIAIGHTRYSTTGSNKKENASPILIDCEIEQFAIAHNGNITNTLELKKTLPEGVFQKTTTDSEILGQVIAYSQGDTLEKKILNAMKKVEGAYCVTILTKTTLYAFRDPHGFRPLSLAKINGSYAISSETCAFGIIGAEKIRDIEPGEVIKITRNGLKSYFSPKKKKSFCIFEFVYFSRPDSLIGGQSVYSVRERLGKALANTCPKDADLVMGVPDSGIPAAIGFSIESGVPFREGLIKNKYIGRTFINPEQVERLKTIRLKLNALRSVITGKKIVLVDDSIVRGNTMRQIVTFLKEKGAKEVHVRITCPPIINPCFFGVDFPSSDELSAHEKSKEMICEQIKADSLEFITLDDMVKATGFPKKEFCLACFNGDYPVPVRLAGNAKLSLEFAGEDA